MQQRTKNLLAATFKMAAVMTLFTAIATLDTPQQAPKAPVPAAATR